MNTSRIEAIEADGRGSLAGHAITCGVCGQRWTTSLSALAAEVELLDHLDYHEERAGR